MGNCNTHTALDSAPAAESVDRSWVRRIVRSREKPAKTAARSDEIREPFQFDPAIQA
jgi:hypothetical protein